MGDCHQALPCLQIDERRLKVVRGNNSIAAVRIKCHVLSELERTGKPEEFAELAGHRVKPVRGNTDVPIPEYANRNIDGPVPGPSFRANNANLVEYPHSTFGRCFDHLQTADERATAVGPVFGLFGRCRSQELFNVPGRAGLDIEVVVRTLG